jgi:diguanylate cyclase (GGDEF)-like protein
VTHPHGELIHLGAPPIDVVDVREPSLVDILFSASLRRVTGRALRELENRHECGPWIAISTATSELIAASPSFDETDPHHWRSRLECGPRIVTDDSPIAVRWLGAPGDLSEDDPALVAAHWVERGLSEVAYAEQRAAIADLRAGQAEARAMTDALTGLANQRAWWDRMAQEGARTARAETVDVIAIVDLDDLKRVNDEQGHLHGDLLIRVAATTLQNAVRPYDVVARVGGDEFAVLAVDFDGEPEELRERITAAMKRAGIEASVGVASPAPGAALRSAYADADRAMYAHKRRRGSAAAGA